MSLINLTSTQLRQAANLKDKIAGLENELSEILGGSGAGMPSPFKASKPVKKKGMSTAGRAKVAAAQKLRWAKIKAANPKTAPKPAKKKFVMSAAAKAKISAAAKARWAEIKTAKK
jgi:hypothetical protein